MTNYLKGILYLLIIAALVALFAWIVGKSNSPKYQINTSAGAIIEQMRELNRLETATFTIEKVIDAGTSGNAFSQFLFGDKILLIARGNVIAGFDLATLNENAVNIENGTILRFQLPEPQILTVALDNSQTRVFDRKLGILTKGNPNLESEARAAAEITIRKAACEAGILDAAGKNAGAILSHLFEAVGFKSVQVIVPVPVACE